MSYFVQETGTSETHYFTPEGGSVVNIQIGGIGYIWPNQSAMRVEVYDDNDVPISGVTYGLYSEERGGTTTLIETLSATDANGIAESGVFAFSTFGISYFVQEINGSPDEHYFMPIGGEMVTVQIGGTQPLDESETVVRVEAYDGNSAPVSGVTYEIYVRTMSKLGTIVILVDTLPPTDASGIAESNAFDFDYKNVIEFFVQEVGTSEEHLFTPVGGDITTVIIGGGRGGGRGGSTDVLPTEVWEYSYPTSGWQDQLESITIYEVDANGYLLPNPTIQTFTYNADGSPTGYQGKALTWEGKRLVEVVGVATYEYDNGGMRTSKTVGSTVTDYYYNGSTLIGMEQGNDILYFGYASGSVVSINLNGTDYYYLRNGQNDIIAIIDNTGTIVVEYA